MVTRMRGFTLLELTLAVVAGSLLLLTLGMFSANITQSWLQYNRENAHFGTVLKLDRVFGQSLSQAVDFRWPDNAEKKLKSWFDGEPDRLRIAVRREAGGRLLFLEFRLDEGVLKVCSQDRPFEGGRGENPHLDEEELAAGVKKLSFLYAFADKEGTPLFTETWNPDDGFKERTLARRKFSNGRKAQ